MWDPPFVDRDEKTGKVVRFVLTSYKQIGTDSQGFIRFSTNEGQTWSTSTQVPQWHRVNEVTLLRAGNGDLVAG